MPRILRPERTGTSVDNVDHLFVRIPRTGSTSMCNALGRPIEHRTASEWIQRLGQSEYSRRYTFSVVRNPYDRFVSMFYFFGMFMKGHEYGPNEFLENYTLESMKRGGTHAFMMRRQVEFVMVREKLAVDYLGRFEALDESWAEIRRHINIETLEHIPWMRRCRFQKEDLTQASKDILYDYYREDFDVLGYDRN